MDRKLWKECVEFHGHCCPGLAIGFQACAAAGDFLGAVPARNEELVCITENDACGVDAVQVITGCTVGKGNLIHRPVGKHAFSFFLRKSGEGLRLVYSPPELPAGREEMINSLLQAEPGDLFVRKKPHYDLPEPARIFNTVVCEECGEGTAESQIRLQEKKKICVDCADEYSRRW